MFLTWCRGSCKANQYCWHKQWGSEHIVILQMSWSPRRPPAPALPFHHKSAPQSCREAPQTQLYRRAFAQFRLGQLCVSSLLLIPRATLQNHSDRPHQVGNASNSNSSSEQLPHMNKSLLPRAATPPTCLCGRQETAARHLQKGPVLKISISDQSSRTICHITMATNKSVKRNRWQSLTA